MWPGRMTCTLCITLLLPGCEKAEEPAPALTSDETRQRLGELLIDAARHGEADRVAMLLERGADVRAHNAKGETVLHAIFSRRNWRLDLGLIMLLVQEGADLNAIDDRGWTPLHAAAERGRREAVEFLLDKGADMKATDRAGQTPLHLAAKMANDKVVKLLVSLGADLHAEDSFGRAPAGWMVKNCFEELSRVLKSSQKTESLCATHKDLQSYTLLYAAVEGHLEVVRHLIDRGADVNVNRSFHEALAVPGVTPLHGAASGGHLEVARLLIASGARTDAKDKYGRSALQWALWKKHHRMAELLRRPGTKPTQGKD